jgi:hypothetical protein
LPNAAPAYPEHVSHPCPVLVQDGVVDPQDGSFATTGWCHRTTLLAKSTIRLENAQNLIRHLDLELGFPPNIAVETTKGNA